MLKLKYMLKRINLQFNGIYNTYYVIIIIIILKNIDRRLGIRMIYSKTCLSKIQNNWKGDIMSKTIKKAQKEISPQQFDV